MYLLDGVGGTAGDIRAKRGPDEEGEKKKEKKKCRMTQLQKCVYPQLFLDGSKTVKGKLEFLCASPWLTGTESEVWLEFKLTSLLCGNIYR